jgi:radical SAM protein with 4Fe4S-binding SPASM domain
MNRKNLHRGRAYIDHAVANGQNAVFLSPVQKLGFAKKNWDEIGITFDEFLDAWRDSLDHIFDLWDRGVVIEERLFAIALQKLFRDHDVRYMDFRNPNGTVLGNIAYDQHGNAFACDEGRAQPFFRIGNVFEQDYAAMVTSARAREIVSWSLRELPPCQICAYKPYCGVHPIVSHAETGNPVPQPLTDFHCQLTQGIFDFLFELAAERPERIAQAQFVHEALGNG